MDISIWISALGIGITSLTLLGGLMLLVFRVGRLVENVTELNTHFNEMNGYVRDHAERIARLEGADD